MKDNFVLSSPACEDLSSITEYLLENVSAKQTRKILEQIEDVIAKLSQTPDIGHERPDLAKEPLRFWFMRPYLIIYRPETSPLQIVRILHSSRDIESILGVAFRS